MRLRFRLAQHLGAPATAEPAAQAEDWLRGRADLLIAGMGGQVPVVVQLGVRPTPIWTGWPILATTAGSDPSEEPGERRWRVARSRRPRGHPRTARRTAARPAGTT
jgi:hypothetical protein